MGDGYPAKHLSGLSAIIYFVYASSRQIIYIYRSTRHTITNETSTYMHDVLSTHLPVSSVVWCVCLALHSPGIYSIYLPLSRVHRAQVMISRVGSSAFIQLVRYYSPCAISKSILAHSHVLPQIQYALVSLYTSISPTHLSTAIRWVSMFPGIAGIAQYHPCIAVKKNHVPRS